MIWKTIEFLWGFSETPRFFVVCKILVREYCHEVLKYTVGLCVGELSLEGKEGNLAL
jgi:hypothetical protein